MDVEEAGSTASPSTPPVEYGISAPSDHEGKPNVDKEEADDSNDGAVLPPLKSGAQVIPLTPEQCENHNFFTESDLQACIKVLTVIQRYPEILACKKYRRVRKLGMLFVNIDRKRWSERKEHQRNKQKAAKKEKQDHDKFLLRSRELCAQRLEAAAQRGLLPADKPSAKSVPLPTASSTPAKPVAVPASSAPSSSASQSAIVPARTTALTSLPQAPLPPPVNAPEGVSKSDPLNKHRLCYICHGWSFEFDVLMHCILLATGYYRQLHFFYDRLCPECADLNWRKRLQTADLRGTIAICTGLYLLSCTPVDFRYTGARVKIGHQCALRLLKCGALVVATTRFPNDCALRFARDPDFDSFKDRLHIYGLNFMSNEQIGMARNLLRFVLKDTELTHAKALVDMNCGQACIKDVLWTAGTPGGYRRLPYTRCMMHRRDRYQHNTVINLSNCGHVTRRSKFLHQFKMI